MKSTELNVFARQFDVNAPQFMKECCENCNGGMYAACWNIFKNLIAMVAVRATEINDPILNVLMLRLNLYDVPNYKRHSIIKQLKAEYETELRKNPKKECTSAPISKQKFFNPCIRLRNKTIKDYSLQRTSENCRASTHTFTHHSRFRQPYGQIHIQE